LASRGREPRAIVVACVAAALRLVLVFGHPVFSDDVYRYSWDGRVVAARSQELAAVLGTSQQALLAELYGGAAEAWSRAARSFLQSGFFSEARAALEQAA
jgi:hypothetical protein